MFKTQLAYENWKSKYRYGEEEPIDTFRRLAKTLASVEKEEDREKWEDKFLRTLVKFNKDGIPVGLKNTTGGRITANIGTGYKHATLLNCYISGPVSGAEIKYQRKTFDGKLAHDIIYKSDDNPDDLINIFLTLLEQAKTLASEGGYGINFDFIRPRGTLIKGTGIQHPGIVSYMKVWDSVSECIVKGTNDGYTDKLKNYLSAEDFSKAKEIVKVMTRKGAMMGVLSCSHPDIEEFVRAKQASGVLTKFNISVLMDDEFINAVENDSFYDLVFKGKVYKRVKARELYDLIMESTYNRAEPGVIFVDNMNRNNPLAYLGKATCCNPCGEVPGLASLTTTCLLGSANLTQYIELVDGVPVFNMEDYKEDVIIFTRLLDNVNDITYNTLPSYDWATKNIRQFGMGLNGLGSALFMLGIPYNSDEAVEFTKTICDIKENLTWQSSALLAKEKGVFPAYIKEKFESTEYFLSDRLWPETKKMLKKYGARNGKTTTNPPLGNSSIICDIVSNGIEPVFLLEYERKGIVKNWPEGLDSSNIKSILKHYKENDYEYWRGEYNGAEYYYEPHNRGLCEISMVRDYGYQWLLDNMPDKDHSKYLITTRGLNVDDHIKIQEVVQYHCNQSVSKCLVEGQIIETDLGPIPVEDFIEGNYSDEGFYPAKKYKVYNKLGKQIPIKLAYFGGEKPSVSIGIEAMPNIETSENHLFETTRGWVRAKDLKKGDFIFEQKYEYIHGKGKEPINFSVESLNLHFYKDIEIPKNMSENLAKFLGMIASDGSVCWPSVSLTEKNEEVGKVYQSLCLDIFKINPRKQVDKRNGVVSWVINSVPLVRFVEFCLQGSKSHNKKIPIAVLRGSKLEKISFLSGLTLDGYYNSQKKCLCVYEGRSYELARNCFALCQQISTEECVWGKKWVKTHKYFIYSVSMYENQIPAIEPHKRREVDSREGFVWLKDSSMDILSKPIERTRYSLLGLKARRNRITRSKSAKKGSLEYRSVRMVKSVEEIGLKKVFDISVDSEDHTYLVNALVTHNTANLPNNFQFEDFKQLYIKAWEKGLNGFTTYREGSMESVISDIKKAEDDKSIIERDIKLPEVFNNGPTSIIKREGKKFYLHFSYLPEDSDMTFPVAMWIYSNNKYKEKEDLKVCNRAARNLAALALQSNVAKDIVQDAVDKSKTDFPHNRLGRLISLCLRHHIPREDILVSILGIDGDNVSTLLTSVRKFISSTIKDGTKLKGFKCEECGSESVILEGGCKKCIDCGFSGCG